MGLITATPRDDGAITPPYQADPIILLYRRPGTVGCYGYEADGTPWATFSCVNTALICTLCGASITSGWERSARSPQGAAVVCCEHVRYTSATLAPEVQPRAAPLTAPSAWATFNRAILRDALKDARKLLVTAQDHLHHSDPDAALTGLLTAQGQVDAVARLLGVDLDDPRTCSECGAVLTADEARASHDGGGADLCEACWQRRRGGIA